MIFFVILVLITSKFFEIIFIYFLDSQLFDCVAPLLLEYKVANLRRILASANTNVIHINRVINKECLSAI